MPVQSRRSFLKQTTAIGGTFALPYLLPRSVFGANDVIRVAVAGIHGRGQSHISGFGETKGCQVTYLIDPDTRLFEPRSASVAKKTGTKPTCVQDIRKALEDKNVDVVSVATTNHWHSLITVWACQAGKDVYVEKPCSHNVFEGRQCVEAARKYQRIVQHGTQSRSSGSVANEIAAVHSGKYGKLRIAKGYCCKPRWSIGFKEPIAPPTELDFDLWLGPASKQPYHQNLVHYNWHWFWDFGNGDQGNQGVHQMDIARWAIKDNVLPKSVISVGGRWVDGPDFKDQGQTPNMLLNVFDFGGPLLVFETRGLVAKKKGDDKTAKYPFKVGNEFYTDQGVIRGGKFYPNGSDTGEALEKAEGLIRPNGPFGNFIDCVRSRKREDLNAEILQGHLSSATCHIGNISYRLGQEMAYGKNAEAMGTTKEITESLEAIADNLKGALNVDLKATKWQLGPKLAFDPAREKFVDNDKANALLTRPYRAPFVVPDKV